jgi:serine/threonine protein kinase
MATRPSIPYYAPPELLPAPLPTVAEILSLERGRKQRLSAEHETPVVRVGDHYAVKFGGKTTLQEGENMLFVQQSTSIPVPKVYALFHDDENDLDFIVQEYIPGKNLLHEWGTLDVAKKEKIVSQLRRNLDELRSIPSPGYYGGIWRQPIRDCHFTDVAGNDLPYKGSAISGPHETEEQWADAMWRVLDVWLTRSTRKQLPLLRRQYHAVFKGHQPVFTHANFFPGNVILREDGTVVIIDWEMSGWYPSFWEYCCSMLVVRYHLDWDEWIPKMMDEYHCELGWMIIHRGLIDDHK